MSVPYPKTRAEFLHWLEEIEAKLAVQGQYVDARLIAKRDQVQHIIDTWEDDE